MPEFVDAPGPQAASPTPAAAASTQFVDAPGPQFVDAPGPQAPAPAPAATAPQLNFAHFKSRYAQDLDAAAARTGLDPKMLRAVHYVEDASEDPNVISSAGAIGEMQMEPGTFKQYAGKGASITDPQANIDAGALFLSSLMHRYDGDLNKVLTAYNAGPGAADKGEVMQDYIARYHAIYNSLTKDDTGPGHAPPALSKGGKKPSSDTRVAQTVPAQALTGGVSTPHGKIEAAPSGILGAIEYAGNALNKNIEGAGANVAEAFKPTTGEQAMLDKYGSLPPVQGISTGARIFGDAAILPFSALDAVMRDVATGNTANIGDLGTRIYSMLKDPLHAGDFLDQLTEKYGPFTRAENLWWANQPGVRQVLAKAQPATLEGRTLQNVLGLRADVGRYLLNKSALSGSLGFITGMLAPVGPEMALMRGAGKIAAKGVAEGLLKPAARVAAAAAPLTAVKVADRAADVSAWMDRAKDAALSTLPIVGDRYYRVHKQFGEVGESEQRVYVRDQSEAGYKAHALLSQEDKLGGVPLTSSKINGNMPTVRDIHQEHDKFYNAHTTLHQRGHDVPYFDPVTGTTTMTKGPYWGKPGTQVAYADHPAPNLPGEPVDDLYPGSPVFKSSKDVKRAVFAGNQDIIDNFDRHVKHGSYSAALRMVPGMTPQDADAFSTHLQAALAGVTGKQAQNALVNDLVRRKLIGHWAIGSGHDAVELRTPHGTQVIIPRQIEAMPKDDRTIGQVSVHDRAANYARVMRAADQGSTLLAPSLAPKMIDGYAPRPKMFAGEQTLTEKLNPDSSLAQKGAGGGATPVTKKREYGSIRQAMARGEQENQDFNLAAASEQSLARSMRFQTTMRYAYAAAKKVARAGVVKGRIDYDAAVAQAIKDGRFLDISGAPRAPMSNNGVVPQLGIGPAGRKAYEKWVAEEAQYQRANGPHKLTPQQIQHTTPEAMNEGLTKAQAALHKGVQEQFESDHPDLIWQLDGADKGLGVEDLAGITMPKVIREAAIDGHPVLSQQAGVSGAWATRDAPENAYADAFETLNNLARTTFMSNVLYHPFKNIARLAFGFGHLNPVEVAQGLFAPHTIDDALLAEAEKMGATSRKFTAGPAGARVRARYGYSTPTTYAHTPKGIAGERVPPSNIGRRIRTAIDGYRNVAADSMHGPVPALNAGMHVLGKAWYNADKWNTDWTFGVWEDALAAKTYGKLRDKGISSGMKPKEARAHAANETRRIMGDTGNLTPMERKLGLQRVSWFYNWTKGQWKLWSRIMSDPRAAQFFTAQSYGLRTANEAQPMPNPQDFPEDLVWGYDGDKPLALRLGGGYMSKAEGIADLATAPFTKGQGLLDFADAAKNDAFNTLNPAMRIIFVNMGETLGYPKGQEPSPWGALADRDLGIGAMAGQMAGQAAKQVQPPELQAFKKATAERDPVYMLDLIGIHAKNLNDASSARVHGIIEGRFRKVLEQSLRYATSNAQREALKAVYGPLIEREENERMELQGY